MHKWTLMKEIEVRSKASDTANNLTDISQWCSKNRWHGDELTVVVGMSRPSVKWYYVRWRLDWSIEDWRHKVRVTTQLIWVNMTDMSQSRREVKWRDHRLIVVVTLSRPSVYENKICCRSGCKVLNVGGWTHLEWLIFGVVVREVVIIVTYVLVVVSAGTLTPLRGFYNYHGVFFPQGNLNPLRQKLAYVCGRPAANVWRVWVTVLHDVGD